MTLHLLPNLLGNEESSFLPQIVGLLVPKLSGIIAESTGGVTKLLKALKINRHSSCSITIFRKQDREEKSLNFFLEPILEGEEWGFVSDSGLPCIADPGASLVRRAYEKNIPVVAYPGPCSITAALMLSGLPGQKFCFEGYLPKEEREREKKIKQLESSAMKTRYTYIFIETPFRNTHVFESLIKNLDKRIVLSIVTNVFMQDSFVRTLSIENWRKSDISFIKERISKKPTVFLFSFLIK